MTLLYMIIFFQEKLEMYKKKLRLARNVNKKTIGLFCQRTSLLKSAEK